jgi:hypothetical protein
VSAAEPLPVYIKLADGAEHATIGWACRECRMYFPAAGHWGTEEQAKKAASECCHRPCANCGRDMGDSDGWVSCPECRKSKEQARKQARIEKARRVKWEDYHQKAVYCEETDAFHYDMDELQEALVELWTACKIESADKPIIWACTVKPFTLSAEDIVYAELETHYEEAADEVSERNMARLQRMLDKWCRDLAVTSYEIDFSTIVEAPGALVDEVRAEIAEFEREMSE